ncbi:hypothetical protein ECANGB1_1211 [Enterospora canceri]|uniref:Uncharacterized protein n=1 Tax=Enterospora canceri TaxID=1081671 RepID=A0A1Y1S7S3_9MICR|nr:hypothetical protein ECANGB1_1211 [Enterospora canceri]
MNVDREIKLEEMIDHDSEETNNAYEVFKEDLNELVSQKEDRKKKTSNFFSKPVQSKEADKINKILNRTVQNNEKMLEKKLKVEFDKKMQRMNKIKSKCYRKKLKKTESIKIKDEIYEEISDIVEEVENDEIIQMNPKLFVEPCDFELDETNGYQNDQNKLKMADLFDATESDSSNSFAKEREDVMREDAPCINEMILPGFDGEWAGEGIETIKNKQNTIRTTKEGIAVQDRTDFTKRNVIVNENIKFNPKYDVDLPQGYTANMYEKKMKMCVNKSSKPNNGVVGDELEIKKLK